MYFLQDGIIDSSVSITGIYYSQSTVKQIGFVDILLADYAMTFNAIHPTPLPGRCISVIRIISTKIHSFVTVTFYVLSHSDTHALLEIDRSRLNMQDQQTFKLEGEIYANLTVHTLPFGPKQR